MSEPVSNCPLGTQKLRYPVVCHLSIVGDAGKDFAKSVQEVLADYRVVEPLSNGRTTPSGRHRSMRVSVEVESRERLESLDQTLRAVPGVRMIL